MNSIGQHDYIKLRPRDQSTDGYDDNNIYDCTDSFRLMSQKDKDRQTTTYERVSILAKKEKQVIPKSF